MNRHPVPGSDGKKAGSSARAMAGLAEDSFDFEVVPSRRRQQAGRARRVTREASDEADRRLAVWDVRSS